MSQSRTCPAVKSESRIGEKKRHNTFSDSYLSYQSIMGTDKGQRGKQQKHVKKETSKISFT